MEEKDGEDQKCNHETYEKSKKSKCETYEKHEMEM